MFGCQKKWTVQELDDLQRMYPDPQYSPEQIVHALPGRSWKAIVHAAHRYGVHRAQPDVWKPEENAILETLYTNIGCSPKELMQVLPGRTWKAIQCQANRCNLHRPHLR